ncbi:MAG: relaxase MobL [Clostridia bacterium]|nr:relaxase MobL [Clostridia bacterium]
MDIDRYKGGVIFKWINKNEIYAKYNGKGKSQNLQAHIDKMHTDYIATRSGVDTGFETHGLFGNILDTDEVEMLELDTIKKHIQNISKKNIDVFKTVISLKNEDAMEYGYFNKKSWKEMLEERMPEIARAFKIPLNDLEWVAAFHAKKDKPHCHLIVWNKNQDMSVQRKPFVNYKQIRSAVAKSVFKEELKAIYEIKDVSKSLLGKMSKNEVNTYKEDLKKLYQNEDLMLNAVNTENTQNFVNKALEDMKKDDVIYISNNSDPENYTQIKKLDNEKFEFKNIGEKALLYKDDTYLEAVTFLSKFSNLKVMKNEDELNEFIQNKKEEFKNVEDELKEIMPSLFSTPIISSNIKQENIEQIINKMAKLEEVSKSFKRGFIYKYQEPESKRILNEITMLLVNSNKDCKNEFNRYVDTCVKIDKMLQKVDTYKDYEKIKNQARNEMIKKIGNQILKSIKETKTEEYERKSAEWKEKREYWNFKTKEFEEKQGEYEARQLLYENQLLESNIRQLIQETYKLLSEESMSKFQRFKRATRTFGDLSKREIKEMIRNVKSSGFDWFGER